MDMVAVNNLRITENSGNISQMLMMTNNKFILFVT